MNDGSASGAARRGQLVGAALLAAMVVVGALIALGAFGGEDPARDASVVDGVRGVEETTALLEGIPQRGITLGDPAAPATIVVFADLKCLACRAFALGPQASVIRELVRTGDAALELRLLANESFGADDQLGRTAAHRLAARDQAWPLTELAFYNQGSSSSAWIDQPMLQGFAAASPLLRGATIDLRPDAGTRALDAAADRLAEELDVAGTPTVFVRPTTDQRPAAFERVDVARFESPSEAIAEAVAGVRGT
ncbi:MAG: thioredoxin domain-containing protein [Patulibacter sp.]|nr:thioredoxin domain-containing protein [Patulibacter sp.]